MTPDPKRIAMWSGLRNLSTAMMYSFAARGDCQVWDEPFYAAYPQATGIDHPMKEAVIAAGLADPAEVAAACLAPLQAEQSLFYHKNMMLHMIPAFDRGFMRGLTNVFPIRHPARVIASYAKKREAPELADIRFVQQAELLTRWRTGWATPPSAPRSNFRLPVKDRVSRVLRICAAMSSMLDLAERPDRSSGRLRRPEAVTARQDRAFLLSCPVFADPISTRN